MPLTNTLKKQVDLPVWEWTRFGPVVPGSGISASSVGDNPILNEVNGRFIYYLLNTTNFWRYDTAADSYTQLASPPNAQVTATSIRFNGSMGFYNRVLAATSTTIRTGMPTGKSAIGYKIRIISGTGAGQERIITDVSEPTIADFGNVTSASTGAITDTSKNWYGSTASADTAVSGAYTGSTVNINGYAGYMLRMIAFGTGSNQIRKILRNDNQTLTIGDSSMTQEPFNNVLWTTAPTAGALYQIESSTVTVDTAWDVTPDQTSRFMIHSGAVWLYSGAAATPFYTLQYYCVLSDMWYAMPAIQNIFTAAPTDNTIVNLAENNTIWWQGVATSGTVTTLVDSSASWNTDEWAGYELYIFSGTGRGQAVAITSNTATTLTFGTITTAPDATSRYQINGYDGGKSTGSNTYNTINDSSKAWSTNRWRNYGLRIVFGKGAGQTRRITANSSTSLTVHRGWNITPDNTSVYLIQGDSETLYLSWGGSAEIYQYSLGSGITMAHHGRPSDSGVACIAAALRCDSNHNIEDCLPIAMTQISGTTTITATTSQSHGLKVGDYVSIRGVTSSSADQYNVTGLVQVTAVPTNNTFTYTPSAAGSGTYSYLTALGTNNISDASKDFRDNVSSATNTSITFTRATPSNINGWYATGTNVTPGTTVTSGAGTVTVQLSGGSATPSGVITFSPWGPTTAITSTYSSGGGSGVATITMTANTNANINGWFVSGTGIPTNTFVTSGAGTSTITLSNACSGAVSGTITFYPPDVAGKVMIMTTAAPVTTTGSATSQVFSPISPVGGTTGFLGGAITAPTTALTRYVITDIATIGGNFDGSTSNYIAGVASGGSTTTLVDANTFWATATGTGSAQGTTITLSAASPGNVNGWYITGTGINTGARVISGAGTTTLTVSIPHSGTVSGTMTCCAWGPSGSTASHLVNKRIKIISGTGINQELAITGVTPGTGTITFALSTAPAANSIYMIISNPVKSTGHELTWVYNNSTISSANKGRYLWCARGGGQVGIDKIDLNTDRILYVHSTPFSETLTTGSWYAYDGGDKLWFTKDATQRVYCIDVNTGIVYGGGVFPYTAGTAIIGNKMEIFTTADRLKYLWLNRHNNLEHFRGLLFY